MKEIYVKVRGAKRYDHHLGHRVKSDGTVRVDEAVAKAAVKKDPKMYEIVDRDARKQEAAAPAAAPSAEPQK